MLPHQLRAQLYQETWTIFHVYFIWKEGNLLVEGISNPPWKNEGSETILFFFDFGECDSTHRVIFHDMISFVEIMFESLMELHKIENEIG